MRQGKSGKSVHKKKKAAKPTEPKKSAEDLNMEMDSYFASKKAAAEAAPTADAA